MSKITITLGKSAYSNRIKQHRTTVKELFDKLSLPEIKNKKDGKYFIFASFKKNIRNAQNLSKHYGATVDLDDTPLSIKEVKKLFSKYQYCIYTTFSHKAPGKGIRYRLVLPYLKPLERSKHSNAMLYIMHKLGIGNVDLSSKVLSQPMYLPATPKAREKHFRFYSKLKGSLFNFNKITISPEMQWEMDQALDDTDEVAPVDVNKEISEGERNHGIARMTGKFISNGMDLNTIHESVLAWNDRNCIPPLPDKDVKVIVDSVYKTHKRNHKDSGWGYDELVRRIKESKQPSEDYDLFIELISGSKSKLKKSQLELLIRLINKVTKLSLTVIRSEVQEKVIEKQSDQEEADANTEIKSAKEFKKKFKDWIYLRKDDKIYNSKNGLVYKTEGFSKSYSHYVEEGNILSTMLKHKSIKQADMMQFFPGKEKVYHMNNIIYANTYSAPDIFPLPGDVSVMTNHFEFLIPDKKEVRK